MIILCHNGPFKSSSSNCFENNGCYYGGSLILDNYINENNQMKNNQTESCLNYLSNISI